MDILGMNINILNIGYVFGIDLLFYAWAIITVIAFIDIIIPDPIPFVDEAILVGASIFLLVLLALRDAAQFFSDIGSYITHPLTLAFILTFLALIIGGKIYKNTRKVRK